MWGFIRCLCFIDRFHSGKHADRPSNSPDLQRSTPTTNHSASDGQCPSDNFHASPYPRKQAHHQHVEPVRPQRHICPPNIRVPRGRHSDGIRPKSQRPTGRDPTNRTATDSGSDVESSPATNPPDTYFTAANRPTTVHTGSGSTDASKGRTAKDHVG